MPHTHDFYQFWDGYFCLDCGRKRGATLTREDIKAFENKEEK